MNGLTKRKAVKSKNGDQGFNSSDSSRKLIDYKRNLVYSDRKLVDSSSLEDFIVSLFRIATIWNILGLSVCLYVGYRYAVYLAQLHEKNLFFSQIKEIEREISFRTEAGLYYSYYQTLVQAPSLISGISELINDNVTEHPTPINVLARMNIYQEVVLAALYRTVLPLQSWMEPIYFYINTVFGLQMLLICSIFIMAWIMSETWLAGLLTALFYAFNRFDTTRVETYMPLRESFSLPFLWAQLASITVYFNPQSSAAQQNYLKKMISVCTFLFALTWQFNQFALLLQALALFAVQLSRLVDHSKILHVYKSHLVSMSLVCLLQFCNLMIPTGLLVSFVLSAIFIMQLQARESPNSTLLWRIVRLVLYGILACVLVIVINKTISLIFRHEADEHIKRFVMAKFGFSNARDFDVRLYLCNGAFEYMTSDVFERLTQYLVFPIYIPVHLCLIVCLVVSAFRILYRNLIHCNTDNGDRKKNEVDLLTPHIAFHTVQTISFGAVALVAVRMKYFWTPYMCVLASVGLGHPVFWSRALHVMMIFSPSLQRLSVSAQRRMVDILRYGALILTIVALLYLALPSVIKDLNHLLEFYDPDTVELMTWIKEKTAIGASFSGSMQLLAGVKLCTGRPITNHPHYEDKALRLRTKQLYQMYGRSSAEDVHTILRNYLADYIILEDSICLSQSKSDQCGLPDIMDIENHYVLDKSIPIEDQAPLRIDSNTPRFCDEIRYERTEEFKRLFRRVFSNKTFRVYKVL